jgi:RND family efflux transporter MFP subunit
VGVTVQAARTGPIRDVATASGTLVPSAAGEWTIFATEPAQVLSLPRQEGDVVAVGDILVEFDIASLTQEVNARQVAVADAATRADRARTEFTRMSTLFERGIASRNAFEAARADQATSESILGQAVAQLEEVKLEQGRATVRARFPGVVTRVWHAQGDFVSGAGNDPVLQVVDPTRLQVAVQLPILQLARIAPGQAATVTAIGADAPLVAVVATKPAAADPNAPTGEVRLAFSEPAALPAGTPASVEILLDQRAEATLIPADALRRDAVSAYVILAGDDGLAHRRDVRTGLVTETLAEVVSGLEPGERVIVGGLDDVEDGTPIAFRE